MTVVLTVNPGSSSLQLHVVDTVGDRVLDAETSEQKPDHESAARALDELLGRVREVAAVGHRLVHGGPDLRRATIVDQDAIAKAEQAASLAPAHVPVTLDLLGLLRDRLPDVPHVLCPDSAFHAGLPVVSRTYPVPVEWRRKYGLRRYGFHGLSYAWATGRAARLLGRPAEDLHLLLAHLGGGCSVCAVRNGSSVDTSMGFTPLEGIPMSRRSGSVDPGMLLWLLHEGDLTVEDMMEGLYHRAGLLGLSEGRSGDTRELVRAAAAGDQAAKLALDVFTRRTSQALAAMAVNLPRLDALVFTGEIGWDQPEVRAAVCGDLRRLGVPNRLHGNLDEDGIISADYTAVPVLVVRPREELQIARETSAALTGR
jgi:acetate kinase